MAKHLAFLFFTLAWLAMSGSTYGCLNGYRENEEASPAGVAYVKSITDHDLSSPWTEVRDDLAARSKKEPTIENLNDYAVALCHTADFDLAIEILQQIEKTWPNEYRTATNLGTAYELAGKNEDALKWIQEGLRRNPASHEESEWIHVAILKAKLELAKNPASLKNDEWLRNHDVLGLDFGSEIKPMRPANLPIGNRGKPLALPAIRDGLQHQLHERIQFTPKPDTIVSQLIFDFANLVYLTSELDAQTTSLPLYQLAKVYAQPDELFAETGLPGDAELPGYTTNEMLSKRLAVFGKKPNRPWFRKPWVMTQLCMVVTLIGVLAGILSIVAAMIAQKLMPDQTPTWVRKLAATKTTLSTSIRPNRVVLLIPIVIVASTAGSDRQFLGMLICGMAVLAASYILMLISRHDRSTKGDDDPTPAET